MYFVTKLEESEASAGNMIAAFAFDTDKDKASGKILHLHIKNKKFLVLVAGFKIVVEIARVSAEDNTQVGRGTLT